MLQSRLVLCFVLCLGLVLADDCSNFNGQNGCSSGSTTSYDDSWAARNWQTPSEKDPFYLPSFQSMGKLTGYADIVYSSDRSSAVVTVKAFVRDAATKLTFSFDGQSSSSNSMKVSSSYKGPMKIKVTGSDGSALVLDDVDFAWAAPAVNQPSNYEDGQKGAIVEMFGWTYSDIEAECAALGKMGYLGVKVYPPQEAPLSWDQLQNGELNPWYFMYQPVSYRLTSRAGTRDQLRSMIFTCRKNNVRVYADAVVNHMTGNGNDRFMTHRTGNGGCAYWGGKNSTAGSPYWSQGFAYQKVPSTGQNPGMEFPAVPYGPTDFHCERSLNSWSDPFILNSGWLSGLSDLNTEKDYVRERIAAYFVDLLSLGFSGFRIDAAKHIQPDSLAAILRIFKDKMGGGDLPKDFITWLEVIIGGEKDLLMCQDNSYNYGTYFANAMKKAGLSDSDVMKVKIWSSDYPKEFPICGQWTIPSERYTIQLDCHDDQFPGSSSRDMGDKGSVLVKEKDINKHREFTKQLFTRTDGNWKIRMVLSSYTFFLSRNAFGPPDGLSDCSLCKGPNCNQCRSVPKSTAHDDSACGYTVLNESGQWQEGVYTRVHRDLSVVKAMRSWMGLSTSVSNEQLGLPSQCRDNSVTTWI